MGRLSSLAAKAARKAAQSAKSKAAGAAERVAATPKPPRPKLEVYHGTPHRLQPETKVRRRDTGHEAFIESALLDKAKLSPDLEVAQQYPLGRFRMDKIGTGEGAQAYGRGLYFAEKPEIARGYRTANLPYDAPNPTIGGVDANLVYSNLLERADRAPIAEGRPLYDQAALLEDIINTGDLMDVEKAMAAGDYAPDTADWFNREIAGKWEAPGSLYKVGLDVDPAQMLSWDTPVTAQPEVMQSVMPLLQKYQIEGLHDGKYPTLGGDLYHQLRLRSDVRDSAMTDMLTGAGIPGIRYQAHGSTGRGTQNYVIMNPDLIEIMKRYNMGGKVEVDG